MSNRTLTLIWTMGSMAFIVGLSFLGGWVMRDGHSASVYLLGIHIPMWLQALSAFLALGLASWCVHFLVSNLWLSEGRMSTEFDILLQFLRPGVRIAVFKADGGQMHAVSKGIAGRLARRGADVYAVKEGQELMELRCRVTDIEKPKARQARCWISWEAELVQPNGLVVAAPSYRSLIRLEELSETILEHLASDAAHRVTQLARKSPVTT